MNQKPRTKLLPNYSIKEISQLFFRQHRVAIRKVAFLGLDNSMIYLATVLSYIFLDPYILIPVETFFVVANLFILVYSILALKFDLCATLYRYTGVKDLVTLFMSLTISFLVVVVITPFILSFSSMRLNLLVYLLSLLIVGSRHILFRIFFELRVSFEKNGLTKSQIRTLVVGAGDGGSIFIKSIQSHPSDIQLVGVVDDDAAKQQLNFYGVKILGTTRDIPELVKQYEIEQITIAAPSLSPEELDRILGICNSSGVTANLIPSIEDVMNGKLTVSRFRSIDVVDLLGREEIELDTTALSNSICGKVILISGAGGSIGSEICRIVATFSPKKIVLLGHGENSIYQIHRELSKKYGSRIELSPVIADVQDRKRIFEVMQTYRPDIVYHAAAHKHVPMMEYNPIEAVKNNVFGSKNMAEAAKAANVQTFVMVSTDKAVNPPNVMGATKRIAEMIVTSLNEKGKTRFAAVRFGNVLGSRGSVIPLFEEQVRNGGPVTVTDFRMTRYFMTIPEASRLVIQAGALAQGGEIFVLDMGNPVKIVELAKKIVKLSGFSEEEIPVVETGIRPGEKLYEELLVANERTDKKVYDKIFVGKAVNRPMEDVLFFLDQLAGCKPEEYKEKLIQFAKVGEKSIVEKDAQVVQMNQPFSKEFSAAKEKSLAPA